MSMSQGSLTLPSKMTAPLCLPIMRRESNQCLYHITIWYCQWSRLTILRWFSVLNISHFIHVPCIKHTFLYYGVIYASSLLSAKVVNLLWNWRVSYEYFIQCLFFNFFLGLWLMFFIIPLAFFHFIKRLFKWSLWSYELFLWWCAYAILNPMWARLTFMFQMS